MFMYLIKGFGLIFIVNCLHPLFTANILLHYASAMIFFVSCSNINFRNDTRIRIYVWLILWLTLCNVIELELRMGNGVIMVLLSLSSFKKGAAEHTHTLAPDHLPNETKNQCNESEEVELERE